MTHMSQMGVIPGLLIILAGLLALHGEDRERARRRFFVFLVVVSFLIFLLLLVTSQIDPNQGDMTAFQLAGLLLPSVVGLLVLTVLNIRQLRGMSRGMQFVVVGMMLA
ncbi:MAG: hypothetical protein K8J31_20650, partial [Anaerolineae bacterium]|nr:hypothetical protein [Anaerolineae bacterium]